MSSKPTRTLLDVAAFAGIAWVWVSVYQSFTRSGLWSIVNRALGGTTNLPGQMLVLLVCVLIGWLAVAASAYVVWSVGLRGRHAADFPVARALR